MSRSTRAAAAIAGLVDDAFTPWGDARWETTADMIEICRALLGWSASREHLDRGRTEAGWQRRRETVREVLLHALETGSLLCVPGTRLVAIGSGEEEPAATLREASLPEPEPTTWFELRVVDEVGDALSGIRLAFATPDGARTVTTDADGLVRVESIDGSFGRARVASLASLRNALGSRWSKPRRRRVPQGAGVVVRELDEAVSTSLSLESETRATLVITPGFRCQASLYRTRDAGHR